MQVPLFTEQGRNEVIVSTAAYLSLETSGNNIKDGTHHHQSIFPHLRPQYSKFICSSPELGDTGNSHEGTDA